MTDQGTESRRSSHRCPNRSHTVFEGWWPDGVVERCAVGQGADCSDIPHIVFPMVAAWFAKGRRNTVWMAVRGRNGTSI